MPATASVAQLKAKLSEYLRQVKGGGELLITERGLPIARLAPLDVQQRRSTRTQRLARAGLLRRAPAKRRRTTLTPPEGDAGVGRDVLDALLTDRRHDR